MRKILLSSTPALLLVIFFSFLTCKPEEALELRVLTFNIHHGETIEGHIDWEAMATVIRSTEPDLVALQEVDVHTSRVNGISLVEKLAAYCQMESYFAKALDHAGGDYGNAVLSAYPILEGQTRNLPSSEGHEPRVAADCLIALPADTIRFISTHFDHVAQDADRPAQAKALLEAYRDDPIPSILAGDLNDTPDSETLRILQQYWHLSGAPTAFTIPVEKPNRKIDYILYAPKTAWEVLHSEVIPDAVSDHLAVLTVFKKK